MIPNPISQQKLTLNAGGRLIDLHTPKVMGVINVTPDSFYAPSRSTEIQTIIRKAEKMLLDGADFLDIGAYSSRPNADDISYEEELARLLPAISSIRKHFPEAILSVDTFRAQVAEAAVQEGADMINDISGGQLDTNMFETVAHLQVPYVLMHLKGTPKTMAQCAQYDAVFNEVFNYFLDRYHCLRELGVHDVLIDPGFGFAKNLEHNYSLMNQLQRFAILDLPILVGISRKSMIYKLSGEGPEGALSGTCALNTIALMKGAHILRVHDVSAAVAIVKIFNTMMTAQA